MVAYNFPHAALRETRRVELVLFDLPTADKTVLLLRWVCLYGSKVGRAVIRQLSALLCSGMRLIRNPRDRTGRPLSCLGCQTGGESAV